MNYFITIRITYRIRYSGVAACPGGNARPHGHAPLRGESERERRTAHTLGTHTHPRSTWGDKSEATSGTQHMHGTASTKDDHVYCAVGRTGRKATAVRNLCSESRRISAAMCQLEAQHVPPCALASMRARAAPPSASPLPSRHRPSQHRTHAAPSSASIYAALLATAHTLLILQPRPPCHARQPPLFSTVAPTRRRR